jgi:hypothetical protein
LSKNFRIEIDPPVFLLGLNGTSTVPAIMISANTRLVRRFRPRTAFGAQTPSDEQQSGARLQPVKDSSTNIKSGRIEIKNMQRSSLTEQRPEEV